jgi:ribonucleotide reductase beta subunit family protein with ferritin-like domain
MNNCPEPPPSVGVWDRSSEQGNRWTGVYTRVYTGSMASKESPHDHTGSARLIFTLPKPLVSELEEYAQLLRNGNKSGFVADAIRSYIDHLRKRRHTQLLRQSYIQAAEDSRAVNREWEPLDDVTWARLDEAERQPKPRT